jgi:NarL family two-component system sensor histidine kinase LiaS
VAQTLEDAQHIASQAHQELTALIRALRPVALSARTLGMALRDLATSWAQNIGIDAVLHIPEDLMVAPEVEQALYRVAEEALANIARHSGATTVTIEADTTSDATRFSIADNGHGFDLDQAANRGSGLGNMRERMTSIGGILLVTSSSKGTRIEALCPFRNAELLALEAEVES